MNGTILNGPELLELGDGRQLRLLSAWEVLRARAQGRAMANEEREQALCANACLLAEAMMKDGRQIFESGQQVLEELTVEQIGELAGQWSQFNRQVNPGPTTAGAEADQLKKAWSTPGMSGCTGVCCVHFQPCPRRIGSGK